MAAGDEEPSVTRRRFKREPRGPEVAARLACDDVAGGREEVCNAVGREGEFRWLLIGMLPLAVGCVESKARTASRGNSVAKKSRRKAPSSGAVATSSWRLLQPDAMLAWRRSLQNAITFWTVCSAAGENDAKGLSVISAAQAKRTLTSVNAAGGKSRSSIVAWNKLLI